MSTRGIMGVRINGQDKLMYKHSDCYPNGLGLSMLEACRKLIKSPKKFKDKAANLVMVDKDSMPTQEEIELFRPYSDLGVGRQTPEDWYCLSRNLQGNLEKTLEIGKSPDSYNFILDSLFCEWAYVANLDDNKFEVFGGFQQDKHEKGRFKDQKLEDERYYPCALLVEFPLDNLPDNETFLKLIDEARE